MVGSIAVSCCFWSRDGDYFPDVIPAKAGIQTGTVYTGLDWVPAFAGMTPVGVLRALFATALPPPAAQH
jgi:hypothetical protein